MTQPTTTANELRPATATGAGANLYVNSMNSVNMSGWLMQFSGLLALYEEYYNGVQPPSGLSALQLASPDFRLCFKVVNICRLIINEPIGYISNGDFKIECDDDLKPWAEKWFKERFKPAMAQLMMYSSMYQFAFAYLWVDDEGTSQGLKVRVIPPIENGKTRAQPDFGSDDETELTGIIIEYAQPSATKNTMRQNRLMITADAIEEFVLDANTAPEDQSKWKSVTGQSVVNEWKLMPVAVCKNQFGSDMTDLLPLQDDLNTGFYELRVARRYHGFPMLVSDDPIVGVVGAGKIISGTNIKRLEPGDLSQIISANQEIRGTIGMVSRSVAINRTSSGGNDHMSGEALKWLMSALMTKCQEKADELAACAKSALTIACKMMARDRALYALEEPVDADGNPVSFDLLENATFSITITPKPPADENASLQAAAQGKQAGIYSQREALVRAGYTSADALRIAKETLEEESNANAGTFLLATQDDEASDPEDVAAALVQAKAATAAQKPNTKPTFPTTKA